MSDDELSDAFADSVRRHMSDAFKAGTALARAASEGARNTEIMKEAGQRMGREFYSRTVGRTPTGQCDRCHEPLPPFPVRVSHHGRLNRRERTWEFCSLECAALWIGPIRHPPEDEWFPGPDEWFRWDAG